MVEPRHSRDDPLMAYVINEPCIGTKDTSCVEVCPVDCIHPTPDEPGFDEAEQLYIDPEECIDCDACVEACPVDAITPEDMVPDEWQKYIEINAAYFREDARDSESPTGPARHGRFPQPRRGSRRHAGDARASPPVSDRAANPAAALRARGHFSPAAQAITAPARTIAHARRSLSMRGLVQRRFAYDGVTPHFAFDISKSGLQLLGSLNIRRL